ncbi:MAG: tRNA-dihydrouridine synthase [Breznakibacter sp.]
MTNNLWSNYSSPIFVLAPMEDVTDTSFREIVLRHSEKDKLHVLYTEFLSTDGFCHPQGRSKVDHRLLVSESERKLLKEKNVKLVAQIWGNKPENYYRTIKSIQEEYHFDGIDINMGCPVKNIVAHGSCSALIDHPSLAHEIIMASKEATSLPLSLKTRLGVKKIDTERWFSFLLTHPLDAIVVHGRIQKQMSEGIANWQEIAKVVRLKDEMAPHIRIIGNGDIFSLAQAREYSNLYGVDGVMIGRGIFKNPWLFSERYETGITKRIDTLRSHLDLFESVWGKNKNFAILQRFFKIYLNGFDGASDLRQQLMGTKSYDGARFVIEAFMNNSVINCAPKRALEACIR